MAGGTDRLSSVAVPTCQPCIPNPRTIIRYSDLTWAVGGPHCMYTCIHGNLPTHAARMQIATECGFCCRCSDNTLGASSHDRTRMDRILPDPDGIRSTGYGRKFACNCNCAITQGILLPACLHFTTVISLSSSTLRRTSLVDLPQMPKLPDVDRPACRRLHSPSLHHSLALW